METTHEQLSRGVLAAGILTSREAATAGSRTRQRAVQRDETIKAANAATAGLACQQT